MVFCRNCKYFIKCNFSRGASETCETPNNIEEKNNYKEIWTVYKSYPAKKNYDNNCPDFKPKLWQRFLNLFRKNKV